MTMPADRWQLANRLFEEALELPDGARAAFLLTRCQVGHDVRATVERWLDADAEAANFLDKPLVALPRATRATVPTEMPERIGPYRLIEEIGRGGMSVVYRAIRDDQVFDRDVAIKRVAAGVMSAEAHRRFDIERRVLATLDHPWIASVHDGGTTRDGTPYLVMEHVNGEPIDRHCDRLGLHTWQRIVLFRKVCQAVQVCHRNLIVHCDLKPGNILVTQDGTPKLLDFGIVKLLGHDRASGVSSESETVWPRPLTPRYASPEQREGRAISTASDVYALGTLLGELVLGRKGPVENNRSPHQRPPVDLEAIVDRATMVEPAARYGSVEQLSDDLRRHLEGFPVRARGGGIVYRLGRTLRRNAALVSTVLAVTALLAVSSIRTASLADRLAMEKEKLESVESFFRKIFENAGPTGENAELTLRQAVDTERELIDDSFRDQPDARGAIHAILGAIYVDFGDPEQALVLTDEALTLNRDRYGAGSREEVGVLVTRSAALRELRRHDEAAATLQPALAWKPESGTTDMALRVRVLNTHVLNRCYLERYESVERESTQALDLATRYLGPRTLETAAATVQRALILRMTGNDAEAEALYRKGLELFAQNQGESHPYRATLLNNLALIQRDLGDRSAARANLEAADAQYVVAFGRNARQRARPLLALAQHLAQDGLDEEALVHFRTAVEISLASGATDYIIRSAQDLAAFLIERGNCAGGEDLVRASLDAGREAALDSWRYHALASQLGVCLGQTGNIREARLQLTASLEALRRLEAKGEVIATTEAYLAALDDP